MDLFRCVPTRLADDDPFPFLVPLQNGARPKAQFPAHLGRNRDLPLASALEQMRSAHQDMMALLQPLTDADLRKRLKPAYPGEFGDWDDPHLLPMIIGNTSGHYEEHMPWIEELVGS